MGLLSPLAFILGLGVLITSILADAVRPLQNNELPRWSDLKPTSRHLFEDEENEDQSDEYHEASRVEDDEGQLSFAEKKSEFDTMIHSLLTFTEACGWDNSLTPVTFNQTKFAGRQALAKRDIKFGELLMGIPLECLVTNVVASRELPILSHFNADKHVTIWLMYVKLRGDTHPWWPYISTIPEASGSLVFFNKAEMAAFQDRSIVVLRRKQLLHYTRGFRKIAKVLKEFAPDLDALQFTEELYIWARVAWLSRFFNIWTKDGNVTVVGGMTPYSDLFNHNSPPACNQDDDVTMFGWNEDDRVFEIKANADYKAGTEVGLCYNPLSNKDLLEDYGFAMENNRYNTLTLTKPPASSSVSATLLLSRFPLVLSSDTLATAETTYASLSTSLCGNHTKHQCTSLLTRVIVQQLRSFPTSLQVDMDILKTGLLPQGRSGDTGRGEAPRRLSGNMRSAVVYRKEQKRLLHWILDILSGLRGT